MMMVVVDGGDHDMMMVVVDGDDHDMMVGRWW